MQQITIELQENTANKFNSYIKLFGTKDIMFNKFISFHINRLKREISRMQTELDKYEKKYDMKTSDFYNVFDAGKMGDKKDFMLWAGIYELQKDSKIKLNEISL